MKKILFVILLIFLSISVNALDFDLQDSFNRSNRAIGGDTADNGNVWTETGSTSDIVSEYLRINDVGTDPKAELNVNRTIDASNDDDLEIYFKILTEDGLKFSPRMMDTSSKIIAYMEIDGSFNMQCWNNSGLQNTGWTLTINTWYELFIHLNFTDSTFDFEVVGVGNFTDCDFFEPHAPFSDFNRVLFLAANGGTARIDEIKIVNVSEIIIIENLTINNQTFNMTSDGGCTIWRNDTTNNCNTTDGTPTLVFETNRAADCSVRATQSNGDNFPSFNSSFACSTTGGTSHICTVFFADRLLFNQNYLYASCTDGGNATSGSLAINMTAGEGGGTGLKDCIKSVSSGCAFTLTSDPDCFALIKI